MEWAARLTVTVCPARRRAIPAVNPPKPAPAIEIFSGFTVVIGSTAGLVFPSKLLVDIVLARFASGKPCDSDIYRCSNALCYALSAAIQQDLKALSVL